MLDGKVEALGPIQLKRMSTGMSTYLLSVTVQVRDIPSDVWLGRKSGPGVLVVFSTITLTGSGTGEYTIMCR